MAGVADRGPIPDATEARKTVTLLFTDVTGSTALGEELDPEVFRAVMGRYFEITRQAVEHHGGVVEKFVGDAVLAVFGVPLVREDDALRAVRAAKDLAAGLATLSAEVEAHQGVRLELRTGINTGSVVIGSDRAGGSFATGDAVNTASRLEEAARPREVLLGAATYELVRDSVDVEAVAPIFAKGKAQPVSAYRLLSVHDAPVGQHRRNDGALVGRDREMRTLHEALDRTVSTASSHMVTILGGPGLGKSRLVAGFLEQVGDRAVVVASRCVSYGEGITLWPVAQMVRQCLGLTAEESQGSVRSAVAELFDGGDTDDVPDVLLALLGHGDRSYDNEQTSWAVARLVEQLATRCPLVMNLDDVHWAEPSLIDLLTEVRQQVADLPVLVIAQARPELLDQQPTWASGSVNTLTLGLEPFTIEEIEAVLATLAGPGLPREVVEAVSRWTAGNPLFVEETLAHLLERGLIVSTAEGWMIPSGLAGAGIPPNIAALLAARLDRLPAEELRLLERVAVIGLEFTTDDARSLAGTGPDGRIDVARLLANLVRRDLLRRVRGQDRQQWAFKHILVRDVAYDALPKATRSRLHETYASVIEAGQAEAAGDEAAFAAHHLAEAARYAMELAPRGPGVAELGERAAKSLAHAADQARNREDAPTAVVLLRRAADLAIPSSPLRRELLMRLVESLDECESVDEIGGVLDTVEGELDDTATDLDRAILTCQRLTNQLYRAEELDPAVLEEAAIRAVELAREVGEDRRMAIALHAKARAILVRTTWSEFEQLASEVTLVGSPYQVHTAKSLLGLMYLRGPGSVRRYLAHVDEELQRSLTPRFRARVRLGRTQALAALDGPEARAEVDAAIAATPVTSPGDRCFVASMGAVTALLMGDTETSLDWLETVIEVRREQGDVATASTDLATKAALMLELGRALEAVRPVVAEAESFTSRYDLSSLALVHVDNCLIASREGRHTEAADLAAEALKIVDHGDDVWGQADVRRWVAEAAVGRGHESEARLLLAEALERYREKEMLVATQMTERLLAELLPSNLARRR